MNLAESFHFRIKQTETNSHHRMAGHYLDWYVAELAWRESFRRQNNAWMMRNMLLRALAHPVSQWMKGHWQGNNLLGEFPWRPNAPPGFAK